MAERRYSVGGEQFNLPLWNRKKRKYMINIIDKVKSVMDAKFG
jgi:hypothetical protein